MNDIFQHIAVFLLLGFALNFLWNKFFKKPKKATGKGCSSGSCGC